MRFVPNHKIDGSENNEFKIGTVDELLALESVAPFKKNSIFLSGANTRLLTDEDDAVSSTFPESVAKFWRYSVTMEGVALKLVAEYANPNSAAYAMINLGMIDLIPDAQREEILVRLPFCKSRYEPDTVENSDPKVD